MDANGGGALTKWLITWKGTHIWTTPPIVKEADALTLAASVTGRPLKEIAAVGIETKGKR